MRGTARQTVAWGAAPGVHLVPAPLTVPGEERPEAWGRRVPGEKENPRGHLGLEVEAPGIEPGSEELVASGPTRVSRRIYVIGNLRACNRSRPRPYVST